MALKRVCVTGAGGFIGSHVVERLSRDEAIDVVAVNRTTFNDPDALEGALEGSDAVVHLAAMNRGDASEIEQTNLALIQTLVSAMERARVSPHVVFSSSIQNAEDNPYGRSKLAGENALRQWAARTGAPVTALVIPNVYGQGCRPFYNSVVATFCHLLTHGQTPEVHVDKAIELIYVRDLCEEVRATLLDPPAGYRAVRVEGTGHITVSALRDLIDSFRRHFFELKIVPDLSDPLHFNLYSVFVTHMEYADLVQRPVVHADARGELFEIIKLRKSAGQVFFSTTRPGIVRGNHYHTRKMERFCVMQGSAALRLRRVGTTDAVELTLDKAPVFVEIPIFHTHHIENTGDGDLHVLFWSNEIYDPEDADTYYLEV